VRLPGYILAELAVAGILVAGGGFGALQAVRHLRVRAVGPVASEAGDGTPAPRRELSALSPMHVQLESSGTFLGMADELLLDRVRTLPITRFKLNHGGSSLSFRIEFSDGSRAAWKPAQTNMQTIPRKEIAAYRLNRLLGLNAVPPAAPRAVTRDELYGHLHPDSLPSLPRIKAETVFDPNGVTIGTASYWIPIIKDSGFDTPDGQKLSQAWLTQGEAIPPDQESMAAQLSDLFVFDFLTSNPDRYSGGNMKMSPDGKQLFFMDNTMAFFVGAEGNQRTREVLLRTQRFSKSLYEALPRVTVPTLTRALAEEGGAPIEILSPPEIAAVVQRREFVQRHIDGLIKQLGAAKVLYFP
jgi:hypothetical protein